MSSEPITGDHRFILFILPLLCFILHSSSQSDHRQIQILLKFKLTLQNSNSELFNNWHEQNPICNFTGIVCNSDNFVKEINLSNQQLAGTLPFDSICSLEFLQKISLGSNHLYGTISTHISNCTNLQYLDLGDNSFSGEVPELSSLTQLKFLDLHLSGFSGSFPWKSIENHTGLTFLSLGDNNFEITSFPLEVLNFRQLYSVYLTNCSIEAKIPEEIGNLTLLESLEVANNYLVGDIPVEITKLTKLRILHLYDNKLSGILPVGFSNLVNLKLFDVSTNNLEGDISELRNLTLMESLHLYKNKFFGTIPEEFGEFKFLRRFSIYDNKFTGELPAKIGSWAEFEYIDVSENFFTGLIPPDMCKMGKMKHLLMLENHFTGGLPETYAGCSSLLRLRVSNNSLSGKVPDGIWSLPELRMIDLSINQFEGEVGPNIGQAKSLTQLFLANNLFSGELPPEIPSGIGRLKKLSKLQLQDNIFSGSIPESLGSCISLDEINLAGNSFSGPIPATLGSLPTLNSLNLSGNKLTGEIPASLSKLKLTLIDLSNNMLIGRVPETLLSVAGDGRFAGNPGLCADGSKYLRQCSPDSKKSDPLKVAVYCFIAGALLLVLSLSSFLLIKFRQLDNKDPIYGGHSWDIKKFHVLNISEDEILISLKQDNIIGKGGSGNVYKVVLGGGEHLAVKHMWKFAPDSGGRSRATILATGKSRWPEYEAEVAALSSLRHTNVVKLYCSISSEDSKLLVYEYMPNGNLWDRLHTYQKIEMSWNVRYEIAVGAARGLEYLHHACDRPVIHRDVKSSNILLDEEMKPKIADFGSAKIVQKGKLMNLTHVIAGTHGYIAPEYGYTYNVTEKSDIYSFGVVLMELVTGKKPMELEFGENKDIVHWVHNKMRTKDDVTALVDPSITKGAKKEAVKVLIIAACCTMKIPTLRPSMRMVVKMLEVIKFKSLINIVVDKIGENVISQCKT